MRKGLILAGGSGTRLRPATNLISKHLLPIYDKPMIYYPLSSLMLANIREILIITTSRDIQLYKKLLGDGSQWGLEISFTVQDKPNGLAEAFIIGEKFIKNSKSALILGDNIFYGHDFHHILDNASNTDKGASIIAYRVKNPSEYGVVELDKNLKPLRIIEKPSEHISNYAVTGLYFYNEDVVQYAKEVKPSKRGELEITDLNNKYLENNNLNVSIMKRGYAWLDAGTHESLLNASQFVHTIENRQGQKIACLEEIAFRKGWIDINNFENSINNYLNTDYGDYLKSLLNENSI
jgi:glucose-1-phosphate thymidylyltransferase